MEIFSCTKLLLKSGLFSNEQLISSEIQGKLGIAIGVIKVWDRQNLYFILLETFKNYQGYWSYFIEGYCKNEDAFRNVWKIKVTPTITSQDISDDKFLGKFATKLLRKKDRNIWIEQNKFSMA